MLLPALLFLAQGIPPVQACPTPSYGFNQIIVGGVRESFFIEGPSLTNAPPGGYPLLVLFHGSQVSGTDLYNDVWLDPNSHVQPIVDYFTTLPSPAFTPYIVMMHEGGKDHLDNYNTTGNETFQRHTEAVLKEVLCSFPVDRRRIYGWGRSMGGGEALSFAARHRDPRAGWGMFAALLDHSGSVGPMQEYFAFCGEAPLSCNPLNACQEWYEDLYATPNSYCVDPYPFQRACVLDIPFGNIANGVFEGNWATSFANNLTYTPLLVYQETQGTANANLQSQTQELIDLGPSNPTQVFLPLLSDDVTDGHGWHKVARVDARDFFEQHTLPKPLYTTGQGQRTLFAEAGVRHGFFKAAPASGSYANGFGTLIWTLASNTQLTLWGADDIAELTIIDDGWTNLQLGQTIKLRIDNPGVPLPLVVRVVGYGSDPTQVLDPSGSVVPHTWSLATKTLEFTATACSGNCSSDTWEIIP